MRSRSKNVVSVKPQNKTNQLQIIKLNQDVERSQASKNKNIAQLLQYVNHHKQLTQSDIGISAPKVPLLQMKQKEQKSRLKVQAENYISNSNAENHQKNLPNEMNGPQYFLNDTPKMIRTPRMTPQLPPSRKNTRPSNCRPKAINIKVTEFQKSAQASRKPTPNIQKLYDNSPSRVSDIFLKADSPRKMVQKIRTNSTKSSRNFGSNQDVLQDHKRISQRIDQFKLNQQKSQDLIKRIENRDSSPFEKANHERSNSDTSLLRMTPPKMPSAFRGNSVNKTGRRGLEKNNWLQNLSQIFNKNDEIQTQSSSKVIINKCLCECDKDQVYKMACKNGIQWFAQTVIKNKIRRRQSENVEDVILDEYQKCKVVYQNLKKLQPKRQETKIQIDRDLSRTFPKNDYFKTGNSGQKKLGKVLCAFACYDDQADYVQGMNFVVGQLLMHCSGTIAFWLFVELIEECELRDIYQDGLPGLQKHSFIIEKLVRQHLPDLQLHFDQNSVSPEMYATDWIFSLFCSVLPENDSAVTSAFFNKFFRYKWEFFYKLILSILQHIKKRLLDAPDMMAILQQIKIAMSNKNDPYNYAETSLRVQDAEMQQFGLGSISLTPGDLHETQQEQSPSIFVNIKSFFQFQNKSEVYTEFPWHQIMVKTDIISQWSQVDMKEIHKLHQNFDIENPQFK